MGADHYLQKACSYCVYQERTQAEVRAKLKSWGVEAERSEEIIAWLISENFLNEGRFARQFAGGKFRVNKWGKDKIIHALKSKGISDRCIAEALEEIANEDYQETLRLLIQKKALALKDEPNDFVRKAKIHRFLRGKGYTAEDLSDLFQSH